MKTTSRIGAGVALGATLLAGACHRPPSTAVTGASLTTTPPPDTFPYPYGCAPGEITAATPDVTIQAKLSQICTSTRNGLWTAENDTTLDDNGRFGAVVYFTEALWKQYVLTLGGTLSAAAQGGL
jgi:hypothetical protein